MFELKTMTEARVQDVRVLSRKDRPAGEPAGAQLLLRATLGWAVLAAFDAKLTTTFFQKTTKPQGELDGIESAELTDVGKNVKRIKWEGQQTGCTVLIDHGLGDAESNILLKDCTVHRTNLGFKDGGSVLVQWTVDAPALSDETRGKLTGLKSTDIELTMEGPVVAQDELPGIAEPAKPAKRRVKAHEAQAAESEKGPWPFGDKGADNAPNDAPPPEAQLSPRQKLEAQFGG